MPQPNTTHKKFRFKRIVLKMLKQGAKLPVPIRFVVGVMCVIGGFLGFLPILGFWMLPLGIALLGLAIPATRRSIQRWMDKADLELGEITPIETSKINDYKAAERESPQME